MAVPVTIDRQGFLSNVRESGLLNQAELARISPSLPETDRARVVARAMVEMGVLTRFQAERLLAGRTGGFLLGQYRILDQLGRGGMGRVFKARHMAMGRIVALKVLAPNVGKTERARQLFCREFEAVGKLSHPNIVIALDANEINGRHFLVMEFVDGPNLEELVRQQGPLAVGLACDYILQAANGLQAAHLVGIVHRDIKPANLLVQRRAQENDAPGLVKLTDFGLARLLDAETGLPAATIPGKPNIVMGTPDFLAPEQARDQHGVDIRADLYALGCTFFFLLTGRTPFPDGTAIEKIMRHHTEAPPCITDLRPEVPLKVEAILNRLMAKRPDDRFQTPAELTAALEPFAVSGPMPWAPAATSPTVADAGATPLGGETSPPFGGEEDLADALSLLSTNVPAEALLAPPIECVLAAREEEEHLRLRRQAIMTAVILAGNLLFWWLFALLK